MYWGHLPIGGESSVLTGLGHNPGDTWSIPSGKHTKNYGKAPFSMGKSTISMAILNSFWYVYQAGYILVAG